MKNSIKKRIAIILAGVMILSLVFVNPTIVRGSEASDIYEIVTENTTSEDAGETEGISSAETTEETVYTEVGLDVETTDPSTEAVVATTNPSTEETIESYASDDAYGIATVANEEGTTEENTTGDNTLKEPRKVSGTISVEIDGEPVDPDTKTNVKNGTNVNIQLNFKIPNSYNLQLNDHCYYELPIEGLNLTKGEGIIVDMGKILGEWKYDSVNDRLEFWFTDEEFLSKSNITGDIDINANINLDAIDLDDKGDGEIRIGDTYYDIHVNDEDRKPEVTATKSIGKVEFDQSMTTPSATYTLTITAEKDTKNVKFEDVLGDNLWLHIGYAPISIESSINGTISQASLLDFEYDGSDNNKKSGFSGTIPSMKAGETITITYKGFVDSSIYYKQGGYNKDKLTNTLKVTDQFGNGPDPQTATFPDGSISVTKTGTYDQKTGTVTWTITIKNPHKVPVSSMTLVDEPSNQWSEIYESLSNSNLVTINGKSTSVSIQRLFNSSIAFGELLYSSDLTNQEEEYVISYSLKVKDKYKSQVGLKDGNKVTLQYDGNAIFSPDTSYVGIGPDNYLTKKNGKLISGNKIDWTITFEVPGGGLEDVKLRDTYSNTMQLDSATVKIIGPDGTEFTDFSVSEIQPDSEDDRGFEINFTVDSLPEGTYTITYTTDLDPVSITDWTKTYDNKAAYVLDGTVSNTPITGTVDLGDQLKKWGVSSSSTSTGSITNYGTTVQEWRLDFPKFSEMNGTNYKIQDMWEVDDKNPFQYDYVPGSIRAHKVAKGYDSDNPDEVYAIDDAAVTITGNGLEFNITDAIQYAKDKGWTTFYITYQTKIADADMDAFLNSYDPDKSASNQTGYSVKNRARLLDGDDPFGVSNTVTATSKPRAVVDKVGTYNENTVPYAKYKISVNPGGNDLMKGQAQLVLKDTLPADFMLVKDSLKVYYATIGSTALDSTSANANPKDTALMDPSEWSYTYDPVTNILTITIPDETEVIITYDVSIEKKAGTVLDDSNACNSAELVGVTADSSHDDFTVEGVVLGSGATASSTTATLNVYKASAVTKDLLSGAEFSIKIVEYDVETGEISVPETTPQGYKGPVTFMTGADGSYAIKGLYYDKLYELTETKAPDGYIKDDTPRYIVFIGHDNENFDVDREKMNYPEGTEFYEMDSKTVIIENEEMEEDTTTTTEITTEITSETTEVTTEITTEITETTEVTEITTEITTETTETTTETQTKTGDSAPVGTAGMIMFFSAAAVVLLKRKKQNIS